MPRLLDHAARVLLAILVAWLAVEGGLDLDPATLRPGRLHDWGQALGWSREALATGMWPPGLYDCPANALLRVGLGALGEQAGRALWVGAMVLALGLALRRLAGPHPARALGALVLTLYAVQWDFRAINANLLYLGLVVGGVTALERRRPGLAGGLLAVAAVLKVYGVVFLPWLLWRRHGRASLAMGLGLLLVFAVLPGIALGPTGALHASAAWLGALRDVNTAEFPSTYHGYLTSLQRVFGACCGPTLALGLARGVQLTALAGVVAWLRRPAPPLLDAGVLCLAALLASPLSQPAHAVVLLLPAAAAVRLAAERRWVAPALALLASLLLHAAPSGLPKAVALNLALLAGLAVLGFARRAPRTE